MSEETKAIIQEESKTIKTNNKRNKSKKNNSGSKAKTPNNKVVKVTVKGVPQEKGKSELGDRTVEIDREKKEEKDNNSTHSQSEVKPVREEMAELGKEKKEKEKEKEEKVSDILKVEEKKDEVTTLVNKFETDAANLEYKKLVDLGSSMKTVQSLTKPMAIKTEIPKETIAQFPTPKSQVTRTTLAALPRPRMRSDFKSSLEFTLSPTGLRLFRSVCSRVKMEPFSDYKSFFINYGKLMIDLWDEFGFILHDVPKLVSESNAGWFFCTSPESIGSNYLDKVMNTKEWANADLYGRHYRAIGNFPRNTMTAMNRENVSILGWDGEMSLFSALSATEMYRFLEGGVDAFKSYISTFNMSAINLPYTHEQFEGRLQKGFYTNFVPTTGSTVLNFLQVSAFFRNQVFDRVFGSIYDIVDTASRNPLEAKKLLTYTTRDSTVKVGFHKDLQALFTNYEVKFVSRLMAVNSMSKFCRFHNSMIQSKLHDRNEMWVADMISIRLVMAAWEVTKDFARMSLIYFLVHGLKFFARDQESRYWSVNYWTVGEGRAADPSLMFSEAYEFLWDSLEAQEACRTFFGAKLSDGFSAGNAVEILQVPNVAAPYAAGGRMFSLTGEIFDPLTETLELSASMESFKAMVTTLAKLTRGNNNSNHTLWAYFGELGAKMDDIRIIMWGRNRAAYFYAQTAFGFGFQALPDPDDEDDFFDPWETSNYTAPVALVNFPIPDSVQRVNENAQAVSAKLEVTEIEYNTGWALSLFALVDGRKFAGVQPSIPFVYDALAFNYDCVKMSEAMYLSNLVQVASQSLFLNSEIKENALTYYTRSGGANLKFWTEFYLINNFLTLPLAAGNDLLFALSSYQNIRAYLADPIAQKAHGFGMSLLYKPREEPLTEANLGRFNTYGDAREWNYGPAAMAFLDPYAEVRVIGIAPIMASIRVITPSIQTYVDTDRQIEQRDMLRGMTGDNVRFRLLQIGNNTSLVHVPFQIGDAAYSRDLASQNSSLVSFSGDFSHPLKITSYYSWFIPADSPVNPRNETFLQIATFGILSDYKTYYEADVMTPTSVETMKYIKIVNDQIFVAVGNQ